MRRTWAALAVVGLALGLPVAAGQANPAVNQVDGVVVDSAAIVVGDAGYAGTASSVRVTVTRERVGRTEVVTVVPQ